MQILFPLFLALQEGDAAPTGEGSPSMFGNPLVMMLLIFAVFWFIMIGPERKRRKKHAEMLTSLEKGDKVMTTGGLHGDVVQVKDGVVHLQVADGVRLRYSINAIQGRIGDEEAAPKT